MGEIDFSKVQVIIGKTIGGKTITVGKRDGLVRRDDAEILAGKDPVKGTDGLTETETKAMYADRMPYFIKKQIDNGADKTFTTEEMAAIYEKVKKYAVALAESKSAYGKADEIVEMLFDALREDTEESRLYRKIIDADDKVDIAEIENEVARIKARRIQEGIDAVKQFNLKPLSAGTAQIYILEKKGDQDLDGAFKAYLEILKKDVLDNMANKEMPLKLRQYLFSIWLSEKTNISAFIIGKIMPKGEWDKPDAEKTWQGLEALIKSSNAEISAAANEVFLSVTLSIVKDKKDESEQKYEAAIKFLESKCAENPKNNFIRYNLLNIKYEYYKYLLLRGDVNADKLNGLKTEINNLVKDLRSNFSDNGLYTKMLDMRKLQKEIVVADAKKRANKGKDAADKANAAGDDAVVEKQMSLIEKAGARGEMLLLSSIEAIDMEMKLYSATVQLGGPEIAVAGELKKINDIERKQPEIKDRLIQDDTEDAAKTEFETMLELIKKVNGAAIKAAYDAAIKNVEEEIKTAKKASDTAEGEMKRAKTDEQKNKIKDEMEKLKLQIELLKEKKAAFEARTAGLADFMHDDGEPNKAICVVQAMTAIGYLTGKGKEVVKNVGGKGEVSYELTDQYQDDKTKALEKIGYSIIKLKEALKELETLKAGVAEKTEDMTQNLEVYLQLYGQCLSQLTALIVLKYKVNIQIAEAEAAKAESKDKTGPVVKHGPIAYTQLFTENVLPLQGIITDLKTALQTNNLPVQQRARLLVGLIAAENACVSVIHQILVHIQNAPKNKEEYAETLKAMKTLVFTIGREIADQKSSLILLGTKIKGEEMPKFSSFAAAVEASLSQSSNIRGAIVSYEFIKINGDYKDLAVVESAGFVGFKAFVAQSDGFIGDVNDANINRALYYHYKCNYKNKDADKALFNKALAKLLKDYVSQFLFGERRDISQESISDDINLNELGTSMLKDESAYIEALQIAMKLYLGVKYQKIIAEISIDGKAETISGISDFKLPLDKRELKYGENPVDTLFDLLNAINEQIMISKQ